MSDFLKTTNSQVSLPFSGDLDVSITIPKVRPSKLEVNKTAISIYVSSEGSHNPIGCYIYSVPNVCSIIILAAQIVFVF